MSIRQNQKLGDEGLDTVGATVTLVTNAGTLAKRAGTITTEALTTAAGVAQALVLTFSELAVGDLVFLSRMGGTSDEGTLEALNGVITADTLTITLENRHASAAFDGTFIIAYLIVKA